MAGTAQMSLYQDLPFSLCQAGPERVDGVGNYYLQIFAPGPLQLPLSTLYFLDSHGQIPSKVRDPDYDPIKQSQIDWFTYTSQALRQDRREKDNNHLSLAFMHIPIPEYADSDLIVRGGKRREPTEGPSFNSHFYDALAQEGIAVLGCGHDHVNDFCALRPLKESQQDNDPTAPGCATEGAVDLEGIARMATSDITDERGFSNLIQGLGASRLGSGSNMLGRELMSLIL
jgi:hypothetical protein